MAPRPGKTIALALSGGAALTIAHIGALKALKREGIEIGYLAGTSGGALIAALTAAGYPLPDLETSARLIEWKRIAGLNPHSLGILTTKPLGDFIRQRMGDLDFEDLVIPCAVVATNLTTQEREVFTSGSVTTAVEASAAIPEFYRPVELGGHSYIDGGVSEPVPIEAVRTLRGEDAVPVVAISVMRKSRQAKPVKHFWQLFGRVSQMLQYHMARQAAARADLFIEPDLMEFGFFDLDSEAGLIEAGDKAMSEAIPQLRKLLANGQPSTSDSAEDI